jgi:AcrR family transcriptional regulator
MAEPWVPSPGQGRVNQKQRTRRAIVQAAERLAASGADFTMPVVAREALVSEATAYRYFPDLASLLREVDEGTWPSPETALAPVASSTDVVERVAFAAEYLFRGVLTNQGAVRAMMAATITKPADPGRPGHRFGLIDYALAPVAERLRGEGLAQLRRDLAVVLSADALFTVMDQCGLEAEAAVGSAVETARRVTRAALAEAGGAPGVAETVGAGGLNEAKGAAGTVGAGGTFGVAGTGGAVLS